MGYVDGFEKLRTDPRVEEFSENMPFDGKRMSFGGFVPIFEEHA